MATFDSMFKVIAVILVLICDNNAFNLSPKPNIVFREPKSVGLGMQKVRSSYFGFTLNLKQNRLISMLIAKIFSFICSFYRKLSLKL